MIKGPNIVACPILFFSRRKENWIALSYVKWYFFDSSYPFPYDFGHILAQIKLYFIEIRTLFFVVTCLIFFVFIYNQKLLGGVLKLNKNGQF